MTEPAVTTSEPREARRSRAAQTFQRRTRLPMFALSVAMVALVSIHIAAPLSVEAGRRVRLAEWIIWELFIVEFLVSFYLAANKRRFLRDNWIMTLALILPVFRILHHFNLTGALPGAPAYELFAVANRGMSKLAAAIAGRHLLYVLASISLIVFASGAGEYLVEHDAPGSTIHSYSDCIWWAAGTISTVGTELYPVTAEGRIIAILTMLAGVSVIGYTAATLATLFIRKIGRAHV